MRSAGVRALRLLVGVGALLTGAVLLLYGIVLVGYHEGGVDGAHVLFAGESVDAESVGVLALLAGLLLVVLGAALTLLPWLWRRGRDLL